MTRPRSPSSFADTHDELRAVARDLLAPTSPLKSGTGTSISVAWKRIAQAGWTGLELPEEMGGAGATIAELAVVLHEMGRTAALSPYLGTAVVGTTLLQTLSPGGRRDHLIRRIAAGSIRVAVAHSASEEDAAGAEPQFILSGRPGAWRVEGEARFVPDACEADIILLPAIDPDGVGLVVATKHSASGLTVGHRPVLDATRSLADVTASSTPVADEALLSSAVGTGLATAIARIHDRAAFSIACDSLGIAEAMLETTVAYVRVRQQFGRPIGSFQAVKHACANMLLQVAVGEQLVAAAEQALASNEPDAWIAISQAKSYVCSAAVDVAGEAIQLHGGIGYTWEHGIHAYLKRAALNQSLFGSSSAHRKRLACRYR